MHRTGQLGSWIRMCNKTTAVLSGLKTNGEGPKTDGNVLNDSGHVQLPGDLQATWGRFRDHSTIFKNSWVLHWKSHVGMRRVWRTEADRSQTNPASAPASQASQVTQLSLSA